MTVSDMETEELLIQEQEGLTEFTISDSNIDAISRQFNPDLRIAFDLGEPEMLAWAFPPGTDDSLYQEAARYRGNAEPGELSHLIELLRCRQSFQSDQYRRIPAEDRNRPGAPQAGVRGPPSATARLATAAAMSYQESYWNPNAVSSLACAAS